MLLDCSLSYQRCKKLWEILKIMSRAEQLRGMIYAFEHFFILIESNSSVALTENEIAKMFKEARFLEEFCLQLEEKKLSEVFSEKLCDYFKAQGHISYPDIDFFKKVCDTLLSKFLTNSKLSDDMVKVSLEQYVNFCGETRFLALNCELVHTRRAYLELSRFVEGSCNPLDIEARFIYESWCKRLNFKNKNSSSIDESIMEMLQLDENSVKIVFLILCFNDENDFSSLIKNCIISKLICSFSVHNMKIWKCFVGLPVENVKFIVTNFSEFLNRIFDVITISSENFCCNYENDQMIWLPKSSDYLSYNDIVLLLNLLYNVGDPIKDRVRNYFNARKTTNHCLFFEDIEIEVLKSSTN